MAVSEANGQTVYVVLNRSSSPADVKVPAKGSTFVDWLNPTHTDVNCIDGGRPELWIRKSAMLYECPNDMIRIRLPAYGTAVLGETAQARQ